MSDLNLWDSEYKFMCVIWDSAPVNSGRLVELCKEKLGWKKSTTYNAIRKMCEKGLIKNENAVVSVTVPKECVQANESESFVDRTFEGSLPSFLASFLGGKTISEKEADVLTELINAHRED
ncbi:MAG: BlaI/MecI/CopY family transcriptional regulator [Clostridia bacterium]|nr:BlaI/MecI/CopY family transcriptional regulator [Clostridia bacterium]